MEALLALVMSLLLLFGVLIGPLIVVAIVVGVVMISAKKRARERAAHRSGLLAAHNDALDSLRSALEHSRPLFEYWTSERAGDQARLTGGRPTKRPLHACIRCEHTFYPRGVNQKDDCPKCEGKCIFAAPGFEKAIPDLCDSADRNMTLVTELMSLEYELEEVGRPPAVSWREVVRDSP